MKKDDLDPGLLIIFWVGLAYALYSIYLLTENLVVPLVEINSTMNYIEKTLKK